MGSAERLVLIVEENGMVQEIISYLIESKGFKAISAKDAVAAFDILQDPRVADHLEFAVIDNRETEEAQKFVQEMKKSFPKLYQNLPILFTRQLMHS